MENNLVYGVHDKPEKGKLIVFAIQQLLAILAATIAVPAMVGNGMSASAALFGAGAGTLIYQLFTRFRSPVFLGSSFAFIRPMCLAFSGAISAQAGFLGLILGAVFAGLVYVVISLVIRFAGVAWIDKLMPAAVIGPTVALIGLSLAGAAVNDVFSYGPRDLDGNFLMSGKLWVSLVCALVTLFVVVLCSTHGKKMMKLIPFIIGIAAGYFVAMIFTAIGYLAGADALKIVDFAPFTALVEGGVSVKTFIALPGFSFLEAIRGVKELDGAYVLTIAVMYIPVAFVVFAEHIADHKNLSSIIGSDLTKDPGLDKTLLGDGVGSIVGALFGGCPNTTYGESVGCVAITRNASIITITTTAIMAILISFFSPFVALLDSIPGCVMGGVCITLYGFIAVSGLKMFKELDLSEHRNLFVVSVILITGIGGMAMKIGEVFITSTACALVLGIVMNVLLGEIEKRKQKKSPAGAEVAPAAGAMKHYDNVVIFDHPLIRHKIAILRDEATSMKEFRELVEEITTLMTYESLKEDVPTEPREVKTPLELCTQQVVQDNAIAIVPILRAGLGMVNGIHVLFPSARVGHVGMYRDEETFEPQTYYSKLPEGIEDKLVLVVDPMLATGGSACDAIRLLKERGCKHIKFMAIIGAPEGVSRVAEEHPDVKIYVSTLDRELNEKGYILPGLGDAGDRLFGTK